MPDLEKIHENFVEFGKQAKDWKRKCLMLLPAVDKYRIWELKKFPSIFEYAAKLAGLSRATVEDALWILKKAEGKPAIMNVIEKKGLNAVRPVLKICTKENQDFWAKKAENMSVQSLRVYVNEVKNKMAEGWEKLSWNDPDFRDGETYLNRRQTDDEDYFLNRRGGERKNIKAVENTQLECEKYEITIKVSKENYEKINKLKGGGSWDQLVVYLLEMREKELAHEKKELEEWAKEKITRKKLRSGAGEKEAADFKEWAKKNDLPDKLYMSDSRPIPWKIQKFVLERTNGQCGFPDCLRKAEILHHTMRFALTHSHNPDKIIPLCKAHERLAHLGLIENETMDPKYWNIRLKPDVSEIKYLVDQKVQAFRNTS